jgi:hypothetical protein
MLGVGGSISVQAQHCHLRERWAWGVGSRGTRQASIARQVGSRGKTNVTGKRSSSLNI